MRFLDPRPFLWHVLIADGNYEFELRAFFDNYKFEQHNSDLISMLSYELDCSQITRMSSHLGKLRPNLELLALAVRTFSLRCCNVWPLFFLRRIPVNLFWGMQEFCTVESSEIDRCSISVSQTLFDSIGLCSVTVFAVLRGVWHVRNCPAQHWLLRRD